MEKRTGQSKERTGISSRNLGSQDSRLSKSAMNVQKKKLANPFAKKAADQPDFRPQSSFAKSKKSASLIGEEYDTLQPLSKN